MTGTEGFGMIPVHLILLLVKTNHLPETAYAATKRFMFDPRGTPATANELCIQPELRCVKAAGNSVCRAFSE